MKNNMIITKQNIFKMAKNLSNQNYTELLPASENGYIGCTHIVIDEDKNEFWLSTKEFMKIEIEVAKRQGKQISKLIFNN